MRRTRSRSCSTWGSGQHRDGVVDRRSHGGRNGERPNGGYDGGKVPPGRAAGGRPAARGRSGLAVHRRVLPDHSGGHGNRDAQPGDADMTTPPLLGDRTWRRRHSRWLLGPILGIGFLSGFFLFRVAFKMKDRDEMRRILVLYTVPTIVVWIALATSNPDAAKDRPIDVVGQILMMVLWVAGIVHANIINRRYLPWKVSRGEVPAPGATTVQGS